MCLKYSHCNDNNKVNHKTNERFFEIKEDPIPSGRFKYMSLHTADLEVCLHWNMFFLDKKWIYDTKLNQFLFIRYSSHWQKKQLLALIFMGNKKIKIIPRKQQLGWKGGWVVLNFFFETIMCQISHILRQVPAFT